MLFMFFFVIFFILFFFFFFFLYISGFFFFFSSRRRHTRSYGDWSSDVCSSDLRPQPKFTRLTYQLGYLQNARFAKDGQTVVYSAQWNNDPLQVYSVRMEFPQSTKVDLPSGALLALSANGDLELAIDP